MKIEFSSQRREMLLFLTTNMAAVTSRANQQLEEPIVTLATIGLHGRCGKASHAGVFTGARFSRDEIRAPLKTPVWEASAERDG